MPGEDTTIGAAASLIGCALRDYDVSVVDVFRDAGLAPAVASPDVRYPFAKMQAMWRLAVERTGDPCFGLAVAEHFKPQALHGLGFIWLSSDTLFDALQRLVKYQRMISTVIDITLEETENSVRLNVAIRHSPVNIECASIDAAVGVFVNMCRLATCEVFNPIRLSLNRPRPACFDRFEALFRSPVEFGAESNALYFDPASLREPLPGANPELARANDQVVIDYLGRFDRENISMQVRSRLIELLPTGQPTQKDIASSLNFSVRNLQRRLRAEGISFKRLLDETRKDLASQYIKDNHRRIGEITYLLGFSEPSNFTRAFRRWTGVSPNEFRHRA
ncbi:MAG: AraC family transcriptional regulator [Gammaproteobacteria bacterium]|nr:MAG: AraC family transcriptional regulator [Gammaproteobacteria bacterium]